MFSICFYLKAKLFLISVQLYNTAEWPKSKIKSKYEFNLNITNGIHVMAMSFYFKLSVYVPIYDLYGSQPVFL